MSILNSTDSVEATGMVGNERTKGPLAKEEAIRDETLFNELSKPVLDAFSYNVLVGKKMNKQRLASIANKLCIHWRYMGTQVKRMNVLFTSGATTEQVKVVHSDMDSLLKTMWEEMSKNFDVKIKEGLVRDPINWTLLDTEEQAYDQISDERDAVVARNKELSKRLNDTTLELEQARLCIVAMENEEKGAKSREVEDNELSEIQSEASSDANSVTHLFQTKNGRSRHAQAESTVRNVNSINKLKNINSKFLDTQHYEEYPSISSRLIPLDVLSSKNVPIFTGEVVYPRKTIYERRGLSNGSSLQN